MITVKTLHLDGWLSYDKATIQLDTPGIVAIKGETGSGKSAIFEAVYYLLYGDTIRKKSSVTHLPNKILNNGYDISLEFDIDGACYRIQEIRDRENAGLHLYKGKNRDLISEKDPRDTRKKLVEIMNMEKDEFQSIAFVGQQQASILLSGTSNKRGALITLIFGLKKYDDYVEASYSDYKSLCSKKEALDRSINQQLQEIEC